MVSEDHSLGRHVSQRSHRTDRSREKPELRARRPGARSPWRARAGARGERGRRGRQPWAQRPAPGRGRAGSARVRGRGGVRARDPESGSEAVSCGWETRRPREENGRRRRCEAGETQAALRSTRPRAAGWQQSEGERQHKLRRLRGRTRGQGGATPQGVELVESEGRSELGCRVLGAGRSRPSPRRNRERSGTRE